MLMTTITLKNFTFYAINNKSFYKLLDSLLSSNQLRAGSGLQ